MRNIDYSCLHIRFIFISITYSLPHFILRYTSGREKLSESGENYLYHEAQLILPPVILYSSIENADKIVTREISNTS